MVIALQCRLQPPISFTQLNIKAAICITVRIVITGPARRIAVGALHRPAALKVTCKGCPWLRVLPG
jgi:hypothetical protein